MKDFILIALMMLVTFGVRYPVLAFVGRMNLPQWVQRALKFVPVAVLTALCAPIVLVAEGEINLSINNAYLVASVVAILIAWKTRHLLLTILSGMAVYVFWRTVMGA